MSDATKPTASPHVGVVGAGQLARMMGEATNDAGVTITVLATSYDDCAVATCQAVVLGAAHDERALRELAGQVDVITFDHELVDLDALERLETEGFLVRPSSSALRFAVDKAYQRQAFDDAGIAVPRFLVVRSSNDDGLDRFLDSVVTSPVVKVARGGYDGRGVAFPSTRGETYELIDDFANAGEVVVEERLELTSEVAQIVARSVEESLAFYPLVTTVQREGMCLEVRFPSDVDAAVVDEARQVSEQVATLVRGVGVMAIEYFVTERGLFVNEVALRPHNTGHWTIEGARTSQFAQHLRAVSGQPLGEVTPLSNHAVMVNVVGANAPGSLDAARGVGDTFVHDYGKSWRPGRKLGHVTALGDEPTSPHVRAWNSARAYGTVTREI
ncbi:MAG: 5-(carboxyamino)imidazole ribonucleotide synthase [Acidimicrobiales bacterium]